MGHLYDFTGVPEVARNLSSYNDNPRIKLMVLGKGKMLNELVKLKDKLGDKFILLDWIPYMQLPEYVAAADVCILPAFNREVMRDIVPIKIYEYLASGKAVVATKLPALFEEFGSDNGIVFVDDQQGVIPAVQALAQDKEALKSTGLRGASFVAQYRWENLVNDFEQILLDLVRT
jgi:glycosyltransferase involved in cell wall biosynthesis